MGTSVIEPERISVLNDESPGEGGHVLYWMQASVRTRDNPALEHAVRTANDLRRPLLVAFGVDPDYREATPRSLRFMLDGLVDVAAGLRRRKIGFVARRGHPLDIATELAEDAAAIVVDRGYLREPRAWRTELVSEVDVPVHEVEANVVVPVETASDKREWAARTLRPRISEHLDHFVTELRTTAIDAPWKSRVPGLDTSDARSLCDDLGLEHDPDAHHRGGERRAHARLDRFLTDELDGYADAGARIDGELNSRLSMFLHFGQISPVEIVRRVCASDAPAAAVDEFVEELVVRRELAHNYVWFEPDYDRWSALPEWARTTLDEHRDDAREHVYTSSELEAAETDDPYWNAAMIEMRETGYLHNRMRMYWGKRILGWTNTPEYAFRVTLELNNRHLLDGRDPASYANVAWIFGLHDQAFAERDVIGKVRPMTTDGLRRKTDPDAYVDRIEELTGITVPGRD